MARSPDSLAERYRDAIGQTIQRNASANVKLTNERLQGAAAKRKQNELLLAKARDELITKELVTKQASFLLIGLRQKILNMSSTYQRRIIGLTDVNQAAAILREISLALLNELKDLPQTVTDPHWLRHIESDDGNSDRET